MKNGELLLEFVNENFIDNEELNNLNKLNILFDSIVVNLDDLIYLINDSNKICNMFDYLIKLDNYDDYIKNDNISLLFTLYFGKQSIKTKYNEDEGFSYEDKNSKEYVNLVKQYFDDISQYDLIPDDEERELFQKVKDGDEEAKKNIINANLRLVVYICKTFKKDSLPLLDMIQEGNLGLMFAVDHFDTSKNNKFSTYASRCIYYFILRAINYKSRIIKVPHNIIVLLNKMYFYISEYRLYNFDEPNNNEIADYLGLTTDEVEFLLNIQEPTSIDDVPKSYISSNEESEIYEKIYYSEVRKALDSSDKLDDREKKILKYRYGFVDGNTYSLKSVGKIIGISRERVRQIERKSLHKLRHNPILRDEYY